MKTQSIKATIRIEENLHRKFTKLSINQFDITPFNRTSDKHT